MLMEGWQGIYSLVTNFWQSYPKRALCLLGSNPEQEAFLPPLPAWLVLALMVLGEAFFHTDPKPAKD